MLTVAIHQPNYLPYLGYFDKIDKCDVFVFLDSVTYTHNDYRNRNRVKTQHGEHWRTVPVVHKGALDTPIHDIRIDGQRWRKKHGRTLEQSYCRAPMFREYWEFFKRAYEHEWTSLSWLDKHLIEGMCKMLGVGAEFVDSSNLDDAPDCCGRPRGNPTDLLVDICKQLGAARYISGPGAGTYVQPEKFEDAGIEFKWQEFRCPEYPQLHGLFVPNLSAVDYIFNRGRWRG